MKRYALGFVIVIIATLSFFMHRASIKGEENKITAMKPLVINVDNPTNKEIRLKGTYKNSTVKPDEAPKITTEIKTIQPKSKATVTFEPKSGFDWLDVVQETIAMSVLKNPPHTAKKPLGTQSIMVK